MSAPRGVVAARPVAPDDPEPIDVVVLSYDERYLRRRVLVGQRGTRLLIDLATARPLADRERLVLADGAQVAVVAADEALIEVTAPTPGDLARYAWHIGNRHMTCAIEPHRLLIRRDHVLADMLARLGARLRPIEAPFDPEGGAYGHGRTHDHGPAPDPAPRDPFAPGASGQDHDAPPAPTPHPGHDHGAAHPDRSGSDRRSAPDHPHDHDHPHPHDHPHDHEHGHPHDHDHDHDPGPGGSDRRDG